MSTIIRLVAVLVIASLPTMVAAQSSQPVPLDRMTREQLIDVLRRIGRLIELDPQMSAKSFPADWVKTECVAITGSPSVLCHDWYTCQGVTRSLTLMTDSGMIQCNYTCSGNPSPVTNECECALNDGANPACPR